jgi:antitoxin component YwqK of YwqJK toxin-antitoxin module
MLDGDWSSDVCSSDLPPIYDEKDIEYRLIVPYVKSTGEKLTGAVRGLYENGVQRGYAEFRDGIQHGKEIAWYQNGNKRHEVEFDNGVQKGAWVFWFETGNISQIHGKDMIVGFYENGKKQRVLVYADGKLIYSKEWNPDGTEKQYKKNE